MQIFLEHFDNIELQRMLVDDDQQWGGRFTEAIPNMLTTAERLSLPGVEGHLTWFTADATPEKLGAVDWTNDIMIEEESAPFIEAVREIMRSTRPAIPDNDMPAPEEEGREGEAPVEDVALDSDELDLSAIISNEQVALAQMSE